MTESKNKLRCLRREHGLSILALSDATGISYPTAYHLDHGRKNASIGTLVKLADYFGVSLDYLLGLEELSIRKPSPVRLIGNAYHPLPKPHMTGLEYHRRQRHIRQKELAALSGVSVGTISNIELHGISVGCSSKHIVALAAALGIRVEDLAEAHKRGELEAGDHAYTLPGVVCAENHLDHYRVDKHISYRKLAPRLGLTSGQGAQNACERSHPLPRHIEAVSAYEGISTAEFLIRYGRRPAVREG